MGPVHYLSYSFTYLVAATASEQIAFLKQRKAQILLHRAYSPRLTSCPAVALVSGDASGVSQEKTYAKDRSTFEEQLPLACTFLGHRFVHHAAIVHGAQFTKTMRNLWRITAKAPLA